MKKDSVLLVRIPTELKALLHKAAEADGRSMSGVVCKLVSDWVRLPPQTLRSERCAEGTPLAACQRYAACPIHGWQFARSEASEGK
jgi:Arc-like DNA binding domain